MIHPIEIPFSINNTEKYLIYSSIEKRKYHLLISIPTCEIPPDGFPVLYLLDANANFATLTENMRLQCRRATITGLHPSIIVGIGYDSDEPYDQARYYDFTFDSFQENLPKHPLGTQWPPHGGGQKFLSFIVNEVKPFIEQKFKVNPNKQSLLGHSLGGLFVLFCLFLKPDAFQYYIASSPSIHWNETILFEKKQQFLKSLSDKKEKIKLLITMGELEKNHFSNMHEKANMLASEMQAYDGEILETTFYEFQNENHITVLLPLINKCIAFINDKSI
ncbi:alpha/beta hydrolase [Niallia nealsonii]|nr:alpha/beta hydrolase-fold protein [Niallia nealsonii]